MGHVDGPHVQYCCPATVMKCLPMLMSHVMSCAHIQWGKYIEKIAIKTKQVSEGEKKSSLCFGEKLVEPAICTVNKF